MSGARGVVILLGCAGASVVVASCDLFHSTDFQNLCAEAHDAAGCMPEASIGADASLDGPTDFCEASASTALGYAQHACAWLAACESPVGNNAFGPCMIRARLAFDCAINPNQPVLGPLHDFWDALRQAKSCADVDRAVFAGAAPRCAPPGITLCGVASSAGVRLACAADAAAGGEPCLLEGKTCTDTAFSGGGPVAASCTGSGGTTCTPGCSGTNLHDCVVDAGIDGSLDRGVDCALYGGGLCDDGGPACRPTNSVGCSRTNLASCNDAGAALGCPAGMLETVDCAHLTGPGSCTPGPLPVSWQVASACEVEGGACGPDSCTSGELTSCAQGATFLLSCSAVGLGPCSLVSTPDGPRGACAP